ncbi:DUF7558 family protein [Candidatus Halobonum tyrrellensis]|uniref:DUF7558 family protein n=1 Tax=Candidatus Halobonum tyrrellensis TaxID=1431545 RepID=UPI0009B5BDFE|nr:hypothetical protein [Candidatus Halobonum tyrrellensis]
MQRTLTGCWFCEAPPSTNLGTARSWGHDDLVTYPICADCALQEVADPDERGHRACDGCGLVVNTGVALTGFRVKLGHLEGTLRFCERCSPDGRVTYWTRALNDHVAVD